jgi:hypothetical protein
MRGSLLFPIGFDGGKVRSGLVLEKKYSGGKRVVLQGILQGVLRFPVFFDGKNVVSLWWNAW